MQVVEGQSLREVIAGKDLPIERILEIAIQVCEDIKPSNILIDGLGRVRIVDFGLASVVGSDQLTKTGSTLGTIGYMSPEQVRGKEVDHRSDLFSLGVVLYEFGDMKTSLWGEVILPTLSVRKGLAVFIGTP